MSGKENAEANSGAELAIKAEDARSVASLHRYAPSRNTTLGLVSPYDAPLEVVNHVWPTHRVFCNFIQDYYMVCCFVCIAVS